MATQRIRGRVVTRATQPSQFWDVTFSPPALTNPITIFLPDDVAPTSQSQYNNFVGPGLEYRPSLTAGQDYIIRMAPGASSPLQYPVILGGGRNVRVVGLSISIVVQAGCGVGTTTQPTPTGFNLHPLVPDAVGMMLSQSGVSFVEGCHVKLNGCEGDAIVGHNSGSFTVDQYLAQRDIIIQNTRLEGMEGWVNGLHADIFQKQTGVSRNLVFENVTGYTAIEGVVHEANNAQYTYGIKSVVARNFQFVWDPVYGYDDQYDSSKGGIDAIVFVVGVEGARENDLSHFTVTNFWSDHINHDPNGAYYSVSWWNTADSFPYRHYLFGSPEINAGIPPGGDFAPANKVGLNYISPHDGGGQPSPTLEVSDTTVAPSASEVVTVSNGPANAMDWVGLYAVGAPNANFLDWQFLNGTQSAPGGGVSSAVLTFTMPATPGSYEFRFMENNMFILLATSPTVVVS